MKVFQNFTKKKHFPAKVLLIYYLIVKQFGSQIKPNVFWSFIWIQFFTKVINSLQNSQLEGWKLIYCNTSNTMVHLWMWLTIFCFISGFVKINFIKKRAFTILALCICSTDLCVQSKQCRPRSESSDLDQKVSDKSLIRVSTVCNRNHIIIISNV